MRKDLLKIAMRFQIESDLGSYGAVNLNDVLKILRNINESYHHFIQVEFFKSEFLTKIYNKNESSLKTIIKALDLLIVDLKYGSFEAALAPVLNTDNIEFFSDDVKEWKKDKYRYYKEKIFTSDLNNDELLNELGNLYTEDERTRIFTPLFNSVRETKNCKINIKSSDGKKTHKQLILPDKKKLEFYTPKVKKEKENEVSTIHGYFQIEKKDDNIDFKKSKVKKIFYIEELEHDTYPFNPDIIKFNNIIYSLSEKLSCSVEYEDGNYLISSKLLDIVVWGATRDEVEEAFAFAFDSLVKNYMKESDSKLSDDAIKFKKILTTLVKAEYPYEPKENKRH